MSSIILSIFTPVYITVDPEFDNRSDGYVLLSDKKNKKKRLKKKKKAEPKCQQTKICTTKEIKTFLLVVPSRARIKSMHAELPEHPSTYDRSSYALPRTKTSQWYAAPTE